MTEKDAWMTRLPIDDASRRELAAELDRIKRDTYVELEEQVAGWNYTRGAGGYPFHELPVTDREVLVEDYVDWDKYMQRGLTFDDQARVMQEAARDPFPRGSAAIREPDEPGRAERPGPAETPLERVERQIGHIKLRPDPRDFSIEELGPRDTGVSEEWRRMPEIEKLHALEAQPDWSGLGDQAKQAILAREVDFSRITRDQLNSVYEKIGSDDIDERPARRLFDEANYARAVAAADRESFGEQLAKARDTTRNLVESVMLDAWPRAGAIVDFGIDSQEHYEALYYPIRHDEIAPSVLDAAMGHGARLTELVQASPSNPHEDISFHTSWDDLLGRPKPEAQPTDYGRMLDGAAGRGAGQTKGKDGPER